MVLVEVLEIGAVDVEVEEEVVALVVLFTVVVTIVLLKTAVA